MQHNRADNARRMASGCKRDSELRSENEIGARGKIFQILRHRVLMEIERFASTFQVLRSISAKSSPAIALGCSP